MVGFKYKSMELEKNLPVAVKNFRNVDLWGVFGIGMGKLEGNRVRDKLGVNRECQMLRPDIYSSIL